MEPEYILEWFRYGDMDLLSAETLTTHHPVHVELVCFLCQQSAEKYLKGLLIYNGISDPPKIHNLDTLGEMSIPYADRLTDIQKACAVLTRYGVQPRYPHEMEITEQDMAKALDYARQIRDCDPIQRVRQMLTQIK